MVEALMAIGVACLAAFIHQADMCWTSPSGEVQSSSLEEGKTHPVNPSPGQGI